MHRVILLTASLIAWTLVTSCAMKVAPAGGPHDRIPASVIQTAPPSGARSVRSDRITFSFDDYVDRSIRTAFVVQPASRFSTSYSGDEVELIFEEPLLPNTTYVVTLGTEWRDVRGNVPKEAVTVVFSTGEALDSGSVSGTVTATQMKGLTVLLYPDANALPPDFNPKTQKPSYQMPIGSSGTFLIGGLKDGVYRLIVIRDDNKSGVLDQNEDYVFAPDDVAIVNGVAAPQELLLGPSLTKQNEDSVRKDSVIVQKDSIRTDSVRVDPGTIAGTFADSLDRKGPYLLRLRNTTGMVVHAVTMTESGSFVMDQIPPGVYTLDVVIDKNANGAYDHGVPQPYSPGEWWIPMAGSISVRPRWTTEGVSVVLRAR